MRSPDRALRDRRIIEEDVMQVLKQLGAVLVLGVAIAACGGSTATQAPAATQGGGGGGGATEAPGATEDGGGGGNGGNGGNTIGFGNGKVTFSTTGAITTQGEYGFIPAGSLFGGSSGSVLNFGSTDGSDGNVLSVLINADGTTTVSFTSSTLGQIPATECTTSDWNIGAGTASGKFDCKAAFVITLSGSMVEGGTIKGEFNAHS